VAVLGVPLSTSPLIAATAQRLAYTRFVFLSHPPPLVLRSILVDSQGRHCMLGLVIPVLVPWFCDQAGHGLHSRSDLS
jgi:hypothetical protein